MQDQQIIPDKQDRIVELEKQLAVARAKAEQLKVCATTLQREAESVTRDATALEQQINEGDAELARVKAAPQNEWDVASRKLDSMWENLQSKVDSFANQIERTSDR